MTMALGRFCCCLFAALLLASACITLAAPVEPVPPPVKLESLIETALACNPEIRMLAQQTKALAYTVPQAGSLDDPVVGVVLGNVPVGTLALDQTPMSGVELVAKQKVPYPGKLRLRKEIASHRVGASSAEYQQVVDAVTANVKTAYAEYCFVTQAILVTQENKKILEELVEIADIRYSVGKGVQQDTIKARLEVTKLLDELIRLQRSEETVKARINSLLDRPSTTPLGEPAGLEKHDVQLSVAELEEIAEQNNPGFKKQRSDIARFEAARSLAKKDLKPDFEFGVGYRLRENAPGDPVHGKDFWSFSAMINIPIYAKSKQREKIREEETNVQVAQSRLDAVENEAFFQIKDATAGIEEAAKQIELLETGIIPEAELALESSMSAYQADQVDFLTVLSNELALYNSRIGYYRALADHEKSVAQLERVVGKTFF